jgi:DNA-binding Xre family transcriptional regulator
VHLRLQSDSLSFHPVHTQIRAFGPRDLHHAKGRGHLRRAEAGEKAITMNGLAVAAGVAATTITRLARNDQKAASALSLDLAGKVVTVLDCGIEDLLEVVEVH